MSDRIVYHGRQGAWMSARCGLLLAMFGASSVATASSSAGEEWLTLTDAAPPNILFVVDLSSSMNNPCEWGGDESFSLTDSSCIEDVEHAIDHLTKHYDWARYGVVGTTGGVDEDGFTEIVPLGSSHAEISEAVDGLSDKVDEFSHSTRNLAEVLATLSEDYFSNTAEDDDEVDSDGDGYNADWTKAPIQYSCQQNHIIVLTGDFGHNDDNVDSSFMDTLGTDVKCTAAGLSTITDEECQYDNVVSYMNSTDFRSDLSGTNNVKVHTLGLGISSTGIAENLFGNASDETGGDTLYGAVDDGDEIISSLMFMMRDIRSGYYSRSSPVVSADGAFLIYTYYQLGGTLTGAGGADVNPLGEGHIRAYEIDDDPTSSEYGQVQYDGDSDIGGALWDGGELLVSRVVTSGEANPGDLDGIGRRDIFTFWEDAVTVLSSESVSTRRQGLDVDFVAAVSASSTLLDKILDTDTESDGSLSDDAYDLNQDDDIDEEDLQALVDFIRGYPDAEYRYLGIKKGYWKLLDSPHSVPLVIQARDDQYSMDITYRKFLSEMEAEEYPAMVYLAANDGMLHAFFLENLDDGDSDAEEGQEAWAWMPAYLLEREHDQEWAGRAIDMVLYGRTFLMDGTPVAEDVWIDSDGDNVKDCDSVPDDCEWHRVLVVQQGKGGPVTLALDITDPTDPEFLWEQTDETDTTAMGYTVGRPVISNIYDASGSEPHDRWVAMWGSGRAVPLSTSTAYYKSSEANLYMWHVGDTYFKSSSSYLYSQRGDNGHPEPSSSVQYDTDDHYEYGYIAAALAVVDVDSDGDADTVYFPVTASYTPTDMGGDGPSEPTDPGSTWMYKACISTTDPDDLTWVEFYDPDDDGDLGVRPEVYYAATTSWHTDGQLGVYWGTGTPYDRDSSENGYFFAVKDSNPKSCSSFDVNPITDCGSEGVYELDEGEGLTSDPIVYAGVVYFTTWVPDEDRCEGGTGRLYGLDFTDCSEGLDTNGDGDLDGSDTDYIEHDDEYLSSVTVTEQGTVIYGTSNPTTDGSGAAVQTLEVVNDPFLGTAAMAWMEVF
jgi:hypothetical protein